MLTTKDKVAEIVAEYTDIAITEFDHIESFAELNIDSLSLVEIIFDIEEAFDISIPDETELDQQGFSFNNFTDIIHLVSALIEKDNQDV